MVIVPYLVCDPYSLPLGVFDSVSDFLSTFLCVFPSDPCFRKEYIRVSVALSRGTSIKIEVGSKVEKLAFEKVSIS